MRLRLVLACAAALGACATASDAPPPHAVPKLEAAQLSSIAQPVLTQRPFADLVRFVERSGVELTTSTRICVSVSVDPEARRRIGASDEIFAEWVLRDVRFNAEAGVALALINSPAFPTDDDHVVRVGILAAISKQPSTS